MTVSEQELLQWLNEQEEQAQENAIKCKKDKDMLSTNYYDGLADAFHDVISKVWELHKK